MQFHMISGATRPVAPFSHAVETGGFVFVTGQMPDSPEAPGVLPEGIRGSDEGGDAELEVHPPRS